MKKLNDNEIFKKIPWVLIAIISITIIFTIITVIIQTKDYQSTEAYIFDIRFDGEYRIGDGEWQPLSSAKHISSTDGRVELKGVFNLYASETDEEIGGAENGTIISLYLDHINATIRDSSGNEWISECENKQIGKSTCSEMWLEYIYKGNANEEVTIVLDNPHASGNTKAVDSFLKNLRIYNVENHKSLFYNVDASQIIAVILLFVFFFVLLAVALFSTSLRINYTQEIWLAWLLVLFWGIYFIFAWDKISIWNHWYTINTIAIEASKMLYLLTAYAIVTSFMMDKERKIATITTIANSVASLVSLIISIVTEIKLYDACLYWTAFSVITTLIIIGCIISMLVRYNKKADIRIARGRKYIYIPAIIILTSFIIDALANTIGLWEGGVLSIFVFLITLLIAIVIVGRVVPKSIRAVLDAKNIEAEKQAMELKLQESRISIMLSQIQPHFLYNTLNSIYQLCESNPMRARSMVNSFAEYLRNNLSTLEAPGLIPFETELSHINTYLDIEKIRFEDTLEIEYDIQCVDFLLPVLTVQPIVENAVKHGTSKKRGGGTVTISTSENDKYYIITISDTGCGFDTSIKKNDGKTHIGIENVRQRLSNMCGGVLTIESEVGVGTVATIRIPKEVEI